MRIVDLGDDRELHRASPPTRPLLEQNGGAKGSSFIHPPIPRQPGTASYYIEVVKAVASSSSIAIWAVWREYPLVWGAIIAASQVLDALKDVFPFIKRHKAASEHTVALDSLFIDAQLEWEAIFSGSYTDDQIAARLHKLRKLQHDAECRSFPEGLPVKEELFRAAQEESASYFLSAYGVHLLNEGENG